MKSHELAEMLLKLPNTDLVGQVSVELDEARLSKIVYPYPYLYVDGEIELGDTSYSDGVTNLHINIHENDIKDLFSEENIKNAHVNKVFRPVLDDKFSGCYVNFPEDTNIHGRRVERTVRKVKETDNSSLWVVRLEGLYNSVLLYENEMVRH